VDPFHNGRILTYGDCCELASKTAGTDLRTSPELLEPVSNRQILMRMLNNLKGIYLKGQAFDKARVVLDLLIDATPGYAEAYHQRGLVYLRQLNFRLEKADLETFLTLDPNSEQRAEAEQQLILIERWKAGLN
jgi:regulator of sirC expression with transglutaminase-like and TPR domain